MRSHPGDPSTLCSFAVLARPGVKRSLSLLILCSACQNGTLFVSVPILRSAIEVHIFPEAMRGTGEGDRPWDLMPKSSMTNANVEQAVTGVEGQTLTLKYKAGEKKIVVPTEA